MKRSIMAALVAALFVSSPALAQTGAEEGSQPAEEQAAEEGAAEAEPASDPEADEGAADSDDGQAAEGDAADGDTAEGDAAAGDTAEGDAAEGEAEEAPLGPGGRPLRTDYPGTEESLKSRMETNKIEGFEVDPDQPSEAYELRIRELETKIDDLKEKVFQSKTRIVLLRETLLSGTVGGSGAVIVHRSDLGPAFKLRQATYSLDGTRIFSDIDKDGSLSDKTTFEVFNGSITPGNHNLSVYLRYQGSGYGVFKYFDGYDFEMRNSCTVTGREGKMAIITVKATSEGDITTSKENEPTLKCTVQYRDGAAAASAGGASEGEGPADGDSESDE